MFRLLSVLQNSQISCFSLCLIDTYQLSKVPCTTYLPIILCIDYQQGSCSIFSPFHFVSIWHLKTFNFASGFYLLLEFFPLHKNSDMREKDKFTFPNFTKKQKNRIFMKPLKSSFPQRCDGWTMRRNIFTVSWA